MADKKKLGRGLSALLGGVLVVGVLLIALLGGGAE